MKGLISNSGGIYYHGKAWRYSHRLWTPLVESIEQELNSVSTDLNGSIVVVGSSAGYLLPSGFLRRFNPVVLIDPDPLGTFFFKRMHTGLNIKVKKKRTFETKDGGFYPKVLLDDLRDVSPGLVYFNNLIGQLALEYNDFDRSPRLWHNLFRHLERSGWHWASVHELYSVELPTPVTEVPSEMQKVNSVNEWIDHLRFHFKDQKLLLRDHMTKALFPDQRSVSLYNWVMTPREWRLINFVSSLKFANSKAF